MTVDSPAPAHGSSGDWTAPDAPADVGLRGLRGHLERLVARHDLRALTVVVDDPDLGRQAFRAGAGAIPAGLTATGPGVYAEPSPSPDALDGDLLVALCAASLRVDVLRGAEGASGELAIRQLPGVYAVAIERDADLLLVRVHVADDAPDDLGRTVAHELTPARDAQLVVEVVRGRPAESPAAPTTTSAPPSPRHDEEARRVELLAVRSVPEDSEIEAHVAVAGGRAVGRAPLTRGLVGAVEAVLAGMAQVTPASRWVPAWARTVETTADGRFVVAVALVDPGGSDDPYERGRHGIATGTSPIEAAAAATARALD